MHYKDLEPIRYLKNLIRINIRCWLMFVFIDLAIPFKCWAANPGFLRPARMLEILIGFFSNALKAIDIRNIWPPWNDTINNQSSTKKQNINRDFTPSMTLPSISIIFSWFYYKFSISFTATTQQNHYKVKIMKMPVSHKQNLSLSLYSNNKYNLTAVKTICQTIAQYRMPIFRQNE